MQVIQAAKHDVGLLYNGHALLRMIKRDITTKQVEEALDCRKPEILRNYPQSGKPYPECLILGEDVHGKNLHILTTYPTVEIITVYEPSPPKWINPRERRK